MSIIGMNFKGIMPSSTGTGRHVMYRGFLRAIASHGSTVFFTTEHVEGQPMGLYMLNIADGAAKALALGGGGTSLAHNGQHVYVTCTDKRLWRADIAGASIASFGEAFEANPGHVTTLGREHVAVTCEHQVVIVSTKDGSQVQRLTLEERPSALASDASGQWLAVGTERGTLAIFESEGKDSFVASASARVHDARVSALLFEEDELRVLSAAEDNTLKVTHARGDLDPEDRGGSANHEGVVTAILNGPFGRFYTVGHDKQIKAWEKGRNKKRPATQSEQVPRVEGATVVDHNGAKALAVIGRNGTLSVFPLAEDGKVQERALQYKGAMDWLEGQLKSKDTAARESAMTLLSEFNDERSLKVLSKRVSGEKDHSLRVLAAKLLGSKRNPKSVGNLRTHLGSSHSDVRVEIFEGLKAIEGAGNLRLMNATLSKGHKDIGLLAVACLSAISAQRPAALDQLVDALNHDVEEVRFAAFDALEAHHSQTPIDAYVLALKAAKVDVRVRALVRCHERGLLGEPRISALIRRMLEDADATVRRYAFLASILRRPDLARALRGRDDVLNRQIFEIETYGKARDEVGEPPNVEVVDAGTLSDEDTLPLLEAMASRAPETCMRGAQGLASLQDARAFGTLLQLSRSTQSVQRVQSAQALESLDDVRSLNRLRMMLRDDDPAVRDAAFSALVKIEDDALVAARAGLDATHEDVRARGLEVLVRGVREGSIDQGAGHALLARTLNDSHKSVRNEALKATLSLKVGGSEPSSLRFATQSMHADVREDVLTEVMAQVKEDWAWEMLLSFFEDPAKTLRAEAFEYALKKAKKNRRRESLEAALRTTHSDVRLKAVKELTSKRLDDVSELIVLALNDKTPTVRLTAVDALVRADARPLLVEAMQSEHDDVRLRAAKACAHMGDARALPVLLELAGAPKPSEDSPDKVIVRWRSRVIESLGALEALGNSDALEVIGERIESEDAEIRRAAVRALVWSSSPSELDTLRKASRHEDKSVQREASLGLAYYGNSAGASVVFGDSGVSQDEALMASLGLLEEAEDQFLAFLDRSDTKLRQRAFLILLLLELNENDGIPDKCLAALSSAYPDVRFWATQGLELFTQGDAFAHYVYERFNDLHEGNSDWNVDAQVIDSLSRVLAHGQTQTRMRAARLLERLHETEQEEFERGWEIFSRRYSQELKELAAAERVAQAPSGKLARAWQTIKTAVTGDAQGEAFDGALVELVFGAYVGLSRQDIDATVRRQALERLAHMADAGRLPRADVQRVLLLGIGDAHDTNRRRSFELLQRLQMDASVLANEALMSGHRDMGSQGLELLASQGGATEGRALLTEIIHTHTDGLQDEAAELLTKDIGEVEVQRIGLAAASESMRRASVANLMRDAKDNEPVLAMLVEALNSRFEDVRHSLATQLAELQRSETFDVLVDMLAHDDAGVSRSASQGLLRLGDERAIDVMLDMIQADKKGDLNVDAMLDAVGMFRSRAPLERLIAMIKRDQHAHEAFQAAIKISGYDTEIDARSYYDWNDVDEEPFVESKWRQWLAKQPARHDDVLATLIELAYDVHNTSMLVKLVDSPARLSPSQAVDAILPTLMGSADEEVRQTAMEVMGWRLSHREGPKAPLLRGLSHDDARVQFLAAEGLGLAGHSDGLAILMTAVNFMEDEDRARAVRALGGLAAPQALELLMGIAQEEYHDVRAEAVEALGHMSQSPRADEIFKLLSRLANGNDWSDETLSALEGLRWFDSPGAWRILYRRGRTGGWRIRERVAQLLRHNTSAESVELLKHMLRHDNDWDVTNKAAESVVAMFGAETLEAARVLITAQRGDLEGQNKVLEVMAKHADAGLILEMLDEVHPNNQSRFAQPLIAMVLNSDPLPVAQVAPLLGSEQARTASIAAQIVGRAGKGAVAHEADLKRALGLNRERYLKAWERDNQSQIQAIAPLYALLLWAAGRMERAIDEVVTASKLPTNQHSARIVEQALLVLGQPWAGSKGLARIEEAATSGPASTRTLATVSLQTLAPERANALLGASIEDAPVFNKLISEQDPLGSVQAQTILREGSARIHTQGVTVPHLVRAADVEGLEAILRDESLSDEVRLGAIDGLARIATPEVDDILAGLGKNEDEDEELRHQAWRAFRRARRLRKRRANKVSHVEEVR